MLDDHSAPPPPTPTVVDRAVMADGTEITLHARGGVYQIRADGRELMDSRHHRTERFLSRLAVRYMPAADRPHVLVGGLGMGFTLRAALDALPADAVVVQVEALSAVVGWNRGALAHLSGGAVDDPRVTVVEDDIVAVLGRTVDTYDAIVLDVDNGPHDLALEGNARLYQDAGLRSALRALRPSGVVAFWSAEPAPDLVERLLQLGVCAWSETVWAMEDDDRVAHALVLAVREARTCALATAQNTPDTPRRAWPGGVAMV
jgi:spermidine synthase